MSTGGGEEACSAAPSGKDSTTSRTDPGWKYCSQVDKVSTNKVSCNFCGKSMNGGITRGKEHLMGKKGKVAACPKCPKEVREELWEHYRCKKNHGSSAFSKHTDILDLGGTEFSDEDGDASVVQDIQNVDRQKKGPMDSFFRKSEIEAEKRSKEKMRQLNVKEAMDKEAVARVHQDIARFWYQAGLSFNAIRLPSFGQREDETAKRERSYGQRKESSIPSSSCVRKEKDKGLVDESSEDEQANVFEGREDEAMGADDIDEDEDDYVGNDD